MVSAILKMYFLGAALSLFAVLYKIVDSVGGQMYVQDQRYMSELSPASTGAHPRGASVKRRMGA